MSKEKFTFKDHLKRKIKAQEGHIIEVRPKGEKPKRQPIVLKSTKLKNEKSKTCVIS